MKKWNYNRKTRNIYRLPHHFGLRLQPESALSHTGSFHNAVDFDLPIGTPIYSALDGIIEMIENDFDIWGPDKRFVKYANLVTIKHPYNEYSCYAHLKKNSVVVEEGQKVKQNQLLGLVGLTGFTTKPHLHFEVFKDVKGFPTLLVQFEYRNKIFTMRSPNE